MSKEQKRDLLFDGELEVLPITDDLHDEIMEYYKRNFIPNENINKACNIGGTEQSWAEIDAVVRVVLKTNLGYVAKNCKTREIVAFCINTLMLAGTDVTLGFKFESPSLIAGAEFVHRMKGAFDIFKTWNIECALEIGFLSTRSDYGGRGLAALLSERSIESARRLLSGTCDDRDTAIPEEIRQIKPQAVCSIFTSLFTQKMGEKLGFETFVRIPFTEFYYEGKSFAERIEPIHKGATYAGMKL